MVTLLDIVKSEHFKFGDHKELIKSIVSVVKILYGVNVECYYKCPIYCAATILRKKFMARKKSKDKFVELEKNWLASKVIQVNIFRVITNCLTRYPNIIVRHYLEMIYRHTL